jgi:hypothetical protein
MFHETKAENRLTGEWFNLTPAQVGAALDRFMAATKEVNRPGPPRLRHGRGRRPKPTPETNQDFIDSLVRQEPWASRPAPALVPLTALEWALEREPVPEAVALTWGSAVRRTLLLERRKHRSW